MPKCFVIIVPDGKKSSFSEPYREAIGDIFRLTDQCLNMKKGPKPEPTQTSVQNVSELFTASKRKTRGDII